MSGYRAKRVAHDNPAEIIKTQVFLVFEVTVKQDGVRRDKQTCFVRLIFGYKRRAQRLSQLLRFKKF